MSLVRAGSIVEADWLARPAREVAPALIGCTLVRQVGDRVVRGVIVETEAYEPGDPACHAYRRRTARNEPMFGMAGLAYVYLIYGMYCCFNVVTDLEDVPSAVLIRALQLESIPPWLEPRHTRSRHRIAAGPGKLSRALGIEVSHSGRRLEPKQGLWLQHRDRPWSDNPLAIVQTTRIGISRGTELPWRWYADCAAVSKR